MQITLMLMGIAVGVAYFAWALWFLTKDEADEVKEPRGWEK